MSQVLWIVEGWDLSSMNRSRYPHPRPLPARGRGARSARRNGIEFYRRHLPMDPGRPESEIAMRAPLLPSPSCPTKPAFGRRRMRGGVGGGGQRARISDDDENQQQTPSPKYRATRRGASRPGRWRSREEEEANSMGTGIDEVFFGVMSSIVSFVARAGLSGFMPPGCRPRRF